MPSHVESPPMNRRRFLQSVAAGAAASVLPWGSLMGETSAAPARRPNILLIVADDLGYGELSCQGCKDIPTPHIDSIAAAGVRFTQGYVSAPLCSPSRAGLATGRYQQRFGHEFNPGHEAAAGFGLPRSETMLSERLKGMGYATGMVGKWHLGFKEGLTPTHRGFDEFFGFLAGAHPYIPGQGAAILRGEKPIVEKEYLTDAFAREATAFIDNHHDHPFFLYVPFNAVHSPLQSVQKYMARFPNLKDKRRIYAGMTAAMDDAVGAMLGRLRKHSLEEDTLVFFISDNGGPTPHTTSSNVPLRGFKGHVWEGGIRLPFMMQWKNHLPAGAVCREPAISLDIHPTAVAAAGKAIDPAWKLDGVNLLPYLKGENAAAPHETLYWRMGDNKYAVRHGDWKMLIEEGHPAPGLFNLAKDIGEKNDLSADKPAKLKELQGLYRAWDAQLAKPRWAAGRRKARKTL
ncbi:MAG: sulfatase-like hydrolase/transferase [Planctomycetaceae bacterium]|nr:sulfatase-like hydrolase/transferase [Planctomycetaceae bacterium]